MKTIVSSPEEAIEEIAGYINEKLKSGTLKLGVSITPDILSFLEILFYKINRKGNNLTVYLLSDFCCDKQNVFCYEAFLKKQLTEDIPVISVSDDNLEKLDFINEDKPDLILMGIGDNGHIGFNEPGCLYDNSAHRQKLTDSTKRMYSSLFNGFENVPNYGYTASIRTFIECNCIFAVAFGASKAPVIYKTRYGKTLPVFPATFLQIPLNVVLYTDRESYSI